jgi:LDH2 family malate/lactate/ureidoglycolate dehydrogenase
MQSRRWKAFCLPFGGHKGAALSMLMDILSGDFTGAAFAGDVTNPHLDFSAPQNVGHYPWPSVCVERS